MRRKVKHTPTLAGVAVAFSGVLDDARTMRLRFETEALRWAGATPAQIARAWRGDFTAADYAETDPRWQEWLPEAEQECESGQRYSTATEGPLVLQLSDAA